MLVIKGSAKVGVLVNLESGACMCACTSARFVLCPPEKRRGLGCLWIVFYVSPVCRCH